MDGRIEGSFPGGPRRQDPGEPPRRSPPLRRVQEIEEGVSRRRLNSTRRKRSARTKAGWLLVLALAFGIGAALGRAGHATQEELTAAHEAARIRDQGISREVNRTLLELWKMEDVEAARNVGRTR